jgi:hypothetical protein
MLAIAALFQVRREVWLTMAGGRRFRCRALSLAAAPSCCGRRRRAVGETTGKHAAGCGLRSTGECRPKTGRSPSRRGRGSGTGGGAGPGTRAARGGVLRRGAEPDGGVGPSPRGRCVGGAGEAGRHRVQRREPRSTPSPTRSSTSTSVPPRRPPPAPPAPAGPAPSSCTTSRRHRARAARVSPSIGAKTGGTATVFATGS